KNSFVCYVVFVFAILPKNCAFLKEREQVFIDRAGKDHFRNDGKLPRVGFCGFWVVDYSCARDSAFFERWTAPARKISRSPSDGRLPRVGFSDWRAGDRDRRGGAGIAERWTITARGGRHVLRPRPRPTERARASETQRGFRGRSNY